MRVTGFKVVDRWNDKGVDEFINEALSIDPDAKIMMYVRGKKFARPLVENRHMILRTPAGTTVYDLDFGRGEFRWRCGHKDVDFKLTVHEQSVLYAHLMADENTLWYDAVVRLRKRLGEGFMNEEGLVLESSVQD